MKLLALMASVLICAIAFGVGAGAIGGPGSSFVVLNCPGARSSLSDAIRGGCDLSARYSVADERFAAVTFGPHGLYVWTWARGVPWSFKPTGWMPK